MKKKAPDRYFLPEFLRKMLAAVYLLFIVSLSYAAADNDTKLITFAVKSENLNDVLIIFKYLNFTVDNLNTIFHDLIPPTNITLPIGISFFTFQAMSYVIDVYRGTVKVQKNLFNLALYISFFPQLIAGPIVRYSTIE